MRLSALVARAGAQTAAFAGDAEIHSLVMDSRKVSPGALFVCMPGMTHDSHGFLPDASARGAVAAIVHSPAGAAAAVGLGMAVVQLPGRKEDFAEGIWRLCDVFFDHPTRAMKLVGVTGTNGKTTVAWVIRDMLTALGRRAGYLGTLGFQIPGEARELSNTTPFAVELYNLLAEARDAGVDSMAIEVSSHALAERRVDGLEFDVGVFTNLTQDHLDFHGTMDAYREAKWRLFSDLPRQSHKLFTAVINVDDPVGELWAHSKENVVLTYGSQNAGIQRSDEHVAVDHLSFTVRAKAETAEISARLGGSYNLENMLSAVSAMFALGYSLSEIADAAKTVRPVPGRFEAVANRAGIGILVDYAHTPDALEKLLEAVRPLTKGRVITVFGCGGDRDRNKRPKMAAAASARSDITIATSDNPRTEDPEEILADVTAGLMSGAESEAIVDRGQAISRAIQIAKEGDVVVIAGKGHENYQIIGRIKHPMDDRELARRGLEARK